MRIVQLIDSLEAGGAERMAVNLANGLAKQVEFSGLVCTRKEGLLLAQIRAEVNYFFMAKKSALDLTALFRLRCDPCARACHLLFYCFFASIVAPQTQNYLPSSLWIKCKFRPTPTAFASPMFYSFCRHSRCQ